MNQSKKRPGKNCCNLCAWDLKSMNGVRAYNHNQREKEFLFKPNISVQVPPILAIIFASDLKVENMGRFELRNQSEAKICNFVS